MQTTSAFQSQFPLSKKKFWKKMVSQLPGIFFFSLILSVVFAMFFMLPSVVRARINVSGFVGIYIFGFLVMLALLLIVYGLYIKAYINRYYYDSTDFITIKKGVFTPTEIHVQYQKIQDVYVDQDIWDRIFGIYDVHIASATITSGIEAHIDGVDRLVAEGLKNFILGKIQGSTSAPAVPVAPTGAPSVQEVVSFSEEISTRNYPIDNRWYTQAILTGIITSFFYAALVVYWIFGRSFEQYSGLSNFSIFLILTGIFFIVQIIRLVIWKSKFYFAFLPQFITQKTGIIATQEKHLPYKSIQDVIIKQSLFEKILGLSTIIVQNAAGGMVTGNKRGIGISGAHVVIPGQPIEKGQKLVEQLNKVLNRKSDSMGL
jgi:membrane protein YdbS with pleckstrin-like domain